MLGGYSVCSTVCAVQCAQYSGAQQRHDVEVDNDVGRVFVWKPQTYVQLWTVQVYTFNIRMKRDIVKCRTLKYNNKTRII